MDNSCINPEMSTFISPPMCRAEDSLARWQTSLYSDVDSGRAYSSRLGESARQRSMAA